MDEKGSFPILLELSTSNRTASVTVRRRALISVVFSAVTSGVTNIHIVLITGMSTMLSDLGMRLTKMIPGFYQEIPQGALPTLYAATNPLAAGAEYYGPGGFGELTGLPKPARMPRKALDENTARRLWQVSEELTGVHFPVG